MPQSIPIFQVDAFADELFAGNPAAVCLLTDWLPDKLLQKIAAENNLSETAFLVPKGPGYELRWFTPTIEVDLCGHATLASAHVHFTHLKVGPKTTVFYTKSGELTVRKTQEGLQMNFPSQPPVPIERPPDLCDWFDVQPTSVLAGPDYFLVYESEEIVSKLRPNFTALMGADLRGVLATAPGDSSDFVSRFFAPKAGIPEDPVTGSAHCSLAPYWSTQLGKTSLVGRQISPRGGTVHCEYQGDRVLLSGNCHTYLKGMISI